MADKEKKDKKNWFRKAKNSLRKNQDNAKHSSNGVSPDVNGLLTTVRGAVKATTNENGSVADLGNDTTSVTDCGTVNGSSKVAEIHTDKVDNVPVVVEIGNSTSKEIKTAKNKGTDAVETLKDNAPDIVANRATIAKQTVAHGVKCGVATMKEGSESVAEESTSIEVGMVENKSTGFNVVTDAVNSAVKDNITCTAIGENSPDETASENYLIDITKLDSSTSESKMSSKDMSQLLSDAENEKIPGRISEMTNEKVDVLIQKDDFTKSMEKSEGEKPKIEDKIRSSEPEKELGIIQGKLTPTENLERKSSATVKEESVDDVAFKNLRATTAKQDGMAEVIEEVLTTEHNSKENFKAEDTINEDLVSEKPVDALSAVKRDSVTEISISTRKTPDFLVDFRKRRSFGLVQKKEDVSKKEDGKRKVTGVATTGTTSSIENESDSDGVREMTRFVVPQGEISAPTASAPSCDVTEAYLVDPKESNVVDTLEADEFVRGDSKLNSANTEEVLHVNIQEEQYSEILSGQLKIKEDLTEIRCDIYKLRQELHEFRKVME